MNCENCKKITSGLCFDCDNRGSLPYKVSDLIKEERDRIINDIIKYNKSQEVFDEKPIIDDVCQDIINLIENKKHA